MQNSFNTLFLLDQLLFEDSLKVLNSVPQPASLMCGATKHIAQANLLKANGGFHTD